MKACDKCGKDLTKSGYVETVELVSRAKTTLCNNCYGSGESEEATHSPDYARGEHERPDDAKFLELEKRVASLEVKLSETIKDLEMVVGYIKRIATMLDPKK